MQKSYKAGELLFAEGDPSSNVMRVVTGTVDIVRALGEETIVLGTVNTGEYLGEMGVIEGQPRSASARAATDIEVEILPADSFFDRVSNDPQTAGMLIRRLSARLRDVSDRLIGAVRGDRDLAATALGQPPAEGDDAEPLSMAIAAGSAITEAQIGKEPRPVEDLPYIVGRWPAQGESAAGVPLDLALDDPEPQRLSRAHFILIEEYGRPVVRDLSSKLGTSVNGRSIGRDFPLDVALLEPGENEIVAGGSDSPYRFLVTVA
ncbi:MAG: cyclic nucleotide-binding domain-containing protein [Alphaproteobacteria bacterium]|nr:cyclic nucleotide-binding domain-containing protein [Alphaproteobacteria bacterium]